MRWISLALLGILIADIWSHQPHDGLTFIQVGQGDCILVNRKDTHLLVDVGPRNPRFDSGSRLVLPELRQQGVTHLDAVFLTHFDQDHIGGLESLLKRVSVDHVVMVTPAGIDDAHRQLLIQAGVRSDQLVVYSSAINLDFPGLTVECMPGILQSDRNDNDQSPYLIFHFGTDSAVLTGDASSLVEAQWIAQGAKPARILKAGHHGSSQSMSPEWLAAIKPAFVVFSAGRNNQWHHPTQEATARAAASGAQVFRTDRDGSVRFFADGGGRLKLAPTEDRPPLFQLFQR